MPRPFGMSQYAIWAAHNNDHSPGRPEREPWRHLPPMLKRLERRRDRDLPTIIQVLYSMRARGIDVTDELAIAVAISTGRRLAAKRRQEQACKEAA